MNHTEALVSGVGGRQILWQSWSPDEPPRAAVVIVHGASEHSGRYQHVAERLTADAHGVYALDHRGHGRSEGPRALIDRLDNAVSDLDQLVLEARHRHPGTPIFMLGHSMGATIALAYAIRHQDRLTGLILSGALAALDAAPAALRLAARVLSAVAPTLPLISIDASLVSRDPAVVSAYAADPLVYHGKLPARTVTELASAIDAFPDRVGAISLPALILYGTADGLAPPAGSSMVAQRLGSAEKTVKAYEGLFHEILNEPERDRVLQDICAWLDERAPLRTDRGAAGSSTT